MEQASATDNINEAVQVSLLIVIHTLASHYLFTKNR